MAGLRNPFAKRNGKIILIEDLTVRERGLNCGCQCPACDGDFIARMGDVKIHHFAHSKDACDEVIAYTSGLYKLIHQILSEGTAFFIPGLVVSYQIPKNEELNEDTIVQYVKIVKENSNKPNLKEVSKGRSVSFDNAELSYDGKNNIQAIELSCRDRKMAIKIMPPDTVCKYATVSAHKDMATLVLDFTDDADKIQISKSVDFQNYLFSENLRKYWISNPLKLKETVYPLLLKKNKKDYKIYLKQQKRIEEEIKVAVEKQKLLDAERQAAVIEQQKRISAEMEIAKQKAISEEKAKEILAYESVVDKFTQQTEKITDCYGCRWIQCEKCGEIKKESEFWKYGGDNRVNLGSCNNCDEISRSNPNET